MNFAEYSAFVKSVAGAQKNAVNPLEYYSIGLFGEAGELANIIKKIEFHKHPFDDVMRIKLVDEAGDCLWYLTAWFCAADSEMSSAWNFGGQARLTDGLPIHTKLTLLSRNVAAIMSNAVPPGTCFRSTEGDLIDILAHYGATLDQAIAANVMKLRLRYPLGFSEAASLNRTDK